MTKTEKVLLSLITISLLTALGMSILKVNGAYMPLSVFYCLWFSLSLHYLFISKSIKHRIILGLLAIIPIQGLFKIQHWPLFSILSILSLLALLATIVFLTISGLRKKGNPIVNLTVSGIILVQIALRIIGNQIHNQALPVYGSYLHFILVAVIGTEILRGRNIPLIERRILTLLLLTGCFAILMKTSELLTL
jgi:hypothetical protein